MKLSTIFSAIVLATAIQTPLQALASTQMCDTKHGHSEHAGSFGGINSTSLSEAPLSSGDYAFYGTHSAGSSFFEELTFSLATTSDVSIDLIDLKMPATTFRSSSATQFSNLLSDKYLTFNLFDNSGQLLGSAGTGSTLTALNLATGSNYVLTVSGKANGVLGGMYAGNVSIAAVSEVPLGATAPLFGSALCVLLARARKLSKVANS